MAKTVRKTMKIFGSTPGTNQITKFGSFAAGSTVYTTDPAVIQALSNYLTGWFSAVVGGNSPCIEDMNAICFLYAYQLYYLLQTGIPEYDTATTYYTGSLCQDGAGNIYYSLQDNNTNYPLNNASYWLLKNNVNVSDFSTSSSSYNLLSTDNGKTFWMPTTKNVSLYLPTAIANFTVTVKDIGGNASIYPITIVSGGGNIENYPGNYSCQSDFGAWTFVCDGTNWSLD